MASRGRRARGGAEEGRGAGAARGRGGGGGRAGGEKRGRRRALRSCFEKKRMRETERPRHWFCWRSWSRLTPSCSKTRQRWPWCMKCSWSCPEGGTEGR